MLRALRAGKNWRSLYIWRLIELRLIELRLIELRLIELRLIELRLIELRLISRHNISPFSFRNVSMHFTMSIMAAFVLQVNSINSVATTYPVILKRLRCVHNALPEATVPSPTPPKHPGSMTLPPSHAGKSCRHRRKRKVCSLCSQSRTN